MTDSEHVTAGVSASDGVGYYRTCPKCGNQFPPRRDSTNTGLCLRCAIENAMNAALDMHYRKGQTWDKAVDGYKRRGTDYIVRNADGTFAQHGRGDQTDTASR